MDIDQMIEILDRFREWARYFGIKTAIPQVQKFMANVKKTSMVPVVGVPVWKREG
jgi:hypothetical protein